MTSDRLTKTAVDRLEPRAKDYFAWCGRLSGFGVRVWPNGRKSFVVQYRTGGRGSKTQRKTIGTYGTVTVDEARKKAEEYLASAQLGNDLIGAERKLRAEMSINALCDEYIAHGMTMKKPATIETDLSKINSHIRPLIGRKRISEVMRQDIERLLSDIANGKTAKDAKTEKGRSIIRGGKSAATRSVRVLSSMFTYAVNQRYVDANPCAGVKLFKDRLKDHFLSNDEIARLFETLNEAETVGLPWTLRKGSKAQHRPGPDHMREVMSPHVTGAIRLLVLTGCRLREILHLRWSEVDFDRNLLFLPDSKTGKKTVYLSAPANDVLRTLPRIGEYAIAGGTFNKPRSDLKRPWKRITQHADIEGTRIHDLRHTFASVGAAQGMPLHMIGKLLGHSSPQTTARYAHLAEDPLRRALAQMTESLPPISGKK